MVIKRTVFTAIITYLVSVISLTGCSNGLEPGVESYPKKPVNVIVSYDAGGGTDTGARILMPYAENWLGVPLNIVNRPGDSGWDGWRDLLKAQTDGYTIAYVNTPNLMTGYLDPRNKNKESLDSFALIVNHVIDYGALAIRPDDKRFSDIKELIEYARKKEVTASTTGEGGDDHIAILKLNKNLGTRFVPVHNTGASNGRDAVLNGYIDVYFANVGEIKMLHTKGELKAIAVMAPERSEFLPDITTIKEAGYPEVVSWSARGIAAKKGTDPAIISKLVQAFEKALNNPEHMRQMSELGLKVEVLTGEDYLNLMKEDEKSCLEVADLLGWE